VPLDKLDSEARALAVRLAKQPARAVSSTKRLMRNPEALMAQILAESAQFAERLQTAERARPSPHLPSAGPQTS
jgi:hypothetical protein